MSEYRPLYCIYRECRRRGCFWGYREGRTRHRGWCSLKGKLGICYRFRFYWRSRLRGRGRRRLGRSCRWNLWRLRKWHLRSWFRWRCDWKCQVGWTWPWEKGRPGRRPRVCRRLGILCDTIEGESDDVIFEEGSKGGVFDGCKGFVIAECSDFYGYLIDLSWALFILLT